MIYLICIVAFLPTLFHSTLKDNFNPYFWGNESLKRLISEKYRIQPKPEHLFHQYRNKAVTIFQLAQFFSRSFETKFHLIFSYSLVTWSSQDKQAKEVKNHPPRLSSVFSIHRRDLNPDSGAAHTVVFPPQIYSWFPSGWRLKASSFQLCPQGPLCHSLSPTLSTAPVNLISFFHILIWKWPLAKTHIWKR